MDWSKGLSQETKLKLRELLKQWKSREETALKFSSVHAKNLEKIRLAVEEAKPFLTQAVRKDFDEVPSEKETPQNLESLQQHADVLSKSMQVIAEAIDEMSKQSSDIGRESNEIAVRSLAVSVEANALSRWAIGISLVASFIAALIASGFWFKFFGC